MHMYVCIYICTHRLAEGNIDLALEFRYDEYGAPSERPLATNHVREHVVARIHYLLALHAQQKAFSY
jgi:hypothetical protein